MVRVLKCEIDMWRLKINRDNSENMLSVTSDKLTNKNGKSIAVKLKGGMFEGGFNGLHSQSHVKKHEHSVYDYRIGRNERKQLDNSSVALLISSKDVKQELDVAKPALQKIILRVLGHSFNRCSISYIGIDLSH